MATIYYGETDRTRGVLNYSTSQSKTAVSITASSTLQAKTYYQSGYRINTYINGERVATKLSSIFYLNTSFTDAFSTSSVTKSFSRKTSAYTVRVESSYAGENDPSSDCFGGSKSGSTYVDITIPALDYYTITYNANGGTGAPSSQGYYYADSGSINLSTTKPTKTGYTFLGWSLSSTATSASYSAGQAWGKSNASNYTLYAVWSENYLTVMYRGNGATSATFKGSSVDVNAPLTEYFYYDNNYSNGLANIQNSSYLYLTRTNYKPTGYWGTTADGTTLISQSTSYTGQGLAEAVGKSLASGNQTVELYAQWELDIGYVNYNLNNGSGTSSQQSATINNSINLHPAPTRTNYRFDGWSDGKNTYAAGQSYKVVSSSVTMTAQWTRIYYEPVINSINGFRSDSEGISADEGTYANITVNYIINPGGASGEASFSTISFKTGTSTLSYTKKSDTNYVVNLNGAASEVPITVTITDTKNNTDSKSFTLPASFFIIDINNGGKSFALGGGAQTDNIPTNGLFQVYMDTIFKGKVEGLEIFEIDSGGYTALKVPSGSYLRTPSGGLLPNVSGGNGNIGTSGWPFNNGYIKSFYTEGIYYQNGDNPYKMIGFVTGDVNGAGIQIGGGGSVQIGAGESINNYISGLTSAGTEDLYLAADENIYFYTNCQSGSSTAKRAYIDTNGHFREFKTDCIDIINNGVNSYISSLNSIYLHFNTDSSSGFYFYQNITTPGSISAGSITTTGNIRTSGSGETSVGVNYNGGSYYLWGNNSSGTRGLWDTKTANYVIRTTDSGNTFYGTAIGKNVKLNSGNISSGTLTISNYTDYKFLIIIGRAYSGYSRVGLVVDTSEIGTSPSSYQITDENYYTSFDIYYSGTSAYINNFDGYGNIESVYGVH